jgi:hypothetical protein
MKWHIDMSFVRQSGPKRLPEILTVHPVSNGSIVHTSNTLQRQTVGQVYSQEFHTLHLKKISVKICLPDIMWFLKRRRMLISGIRDFIFDEGIFTY